MHRFLNPLLKDVIYKSQHDSAVQKQCLQYLRKLRTFQFDGLQTIFLGETNISEGLMTGENFPHRSYLKQPMWTVIHAGSSKGWVPWKYRLILRDELPMNDQEEIFQELCASLRISYGNCVIVVKEKKQTSLLKAGHNPNYGDIRKAEFLPVLDLDSSTCYLQIAKVHGHEILSLPFYYSYLHPMDTAWSSVKWFIVNHRKRFSLLSHEKTYSYQCIYCSDMIAQGIERITPSKWKALTNRLWRWENHYLDKFS
ncbi:protein FAM243A [Rhinatrema bivittatum]|uniref:protein FAM243A n=1 Tax=Rhinatrema bivittatum TaxID=194408 RepID=UPI00112DFA34|nr:protein FAM243A [Rhinatrema bivittatum]